MALHGQVVLAGDPAQLGHEGIAAGGDEARGDDRPAAPVARLRLGDPGACRRRRTGRGLGQLLVGVAVHVDLAHQGDEPAFLQLVHEQQGRRHVDGGEHRRAARGRAAQVSREAPVRVFRIGDIGVARLLGEGVRLQPIEQLEVHAEPAEAVLRGVQVDVVQAGDDEAPRALDHGDAAVALGQLLERAGAHAVLADRVAVRDGRELGRVSAVADVPMQGERPHHVFSPRSGAPGGRMHTAYRYARAAGGAACEGVHAAPPAAPRYADQDASVSAEAARARSAASAHSFTARSTAFTMFWYPVQRQRCPEMSLRISSRV